MRVLPPEVGPHVVTTAERRVHAALAAIDAPRSVALHSLNLPEHAYKISCELDFVLVLDDLVLVLEVKGAQVSCSGGMWTYWDRAGHRRTSSEGPFKQADSGMYALKQRLTERLGEAWVRDVAFGWAVVTPDVDLPASAEWAEETYIGRGQFSRAGGFAAGIERARKHWRSRQSDLPALGSERRDRLVQTLRPDFEAVPPLGARAGELDVVFERLTEEQITRLDMIADNDRVLCTGGAGTGKTFLAAEVARRQARAGGRTAFVCRGDVLASYVRSRVRDAGATVLPISAAEAYGGEPFDYLVVDEAQDMLTFPFLDVLDRILDGGLADGRWTFFYDPNAQARLYDCFDPAAEDLLKSYGAVRAGLSRNCRNTREIAFQTRAHTGADIGVAIAGHGPEVQFRRVEDPEQEAALLEAHLRELREQDVPDGSVTILSGAGSWNESTARRTRSFRKNRIRVLDAAAAADWPVNEMTWSSVVDFKGLENAFVCLIDLEDISTEQALDLLYVAMTRARSGLWVAARPSVEARLAELFREHADEAIAVLAEVTPR